MKNLNMYQLLGNHGLLATTRKTPVGPEFPTDLAETLVVELSGLEPQPFLHHHLMFNGWPGKNGYVYRLGYFYQGIRYY